MMRLRLSAIFFQLAVAFGVVNVVRTEFAGFRFLIIAW
jgi:hypothetical protein